MRSPKERPLLFAAALSGGILAGALAAGLARSLARKDVTDGQEVEITFEDGSTYVPDSSSPEFSELAGMANRVLEIGV